MSDEDKRLDTGLYAQRLLEYLVEKHGSPGEAFQAIEDHIEHWRMMQMMIVLKHEPLVINGSVVDMETVEKAVGMEAEDA